MHTWSTSNQKRRTKAICCCKCYFKKISVFTIDVGVFIAYIMFRANELRFVTGAAQQCSSLITVYNLMTSDFMNSSSWLLLYSLRVGF